jgi:hypothetical protein
MKKLLVLFFAVLALVFVGCKDADDFEITGTTYTVLMLDANFTIDTTPEQQLSYDGVISYLNGYSISSSTATQLMDDMTQQYTYLNGSGQTRYAYVVVDNVGSISKRSVFNDGLNEDAIFYSGIGFIPRQ